MQAYKACKAGLGSQNSQIGIPSGEKETFTDSEVERLCWKDAQLGHLPESCFSTAYRIMNTRVISNRPAREV